MKILQLAVLFLTFLLGVLPIAASAQPFTISADAREVTDQKTGLIWRRCPEGMVYSSDTCTGTASTFTYDEALQQAATQASSTGIDWRLPTVKELVGMTNKSLDNLKVDSVAFPATPPGKFWSATIYYLSSHYAWSVEFTPGFAVSAWYNQFGYGVTAPAHLTFSNYVRLVRDGQLHAIDSAQ